MKSPRSSYSTFAFRSVIGIVVLIALLATLTPLFARQDQNDFLVYPADSLPFGMTYGDWNAAWIQYGLSIPVSINPTLDTTGAYCNVAQSGGPVFFLSGSFSSDPVTRICTVPRGQALLVPLTVWECSTVEPPPFNGSNPQELRACAGTWTDGVGIDTLKLRIDGAKVPGLQHFRAQSPFFDFVMPATDNFLALNGVTSGSSVSDGYFVMVKPLSPGHHTIHFEGATVSGPGAGISMNVTYNLTVQ
jgi:hypothetical protein